MKKKIAAAALIVSMLSISAMGTLAYFTDTGIAHNVITSGKVDITLIDDTEKIGKPFPVGGITNVMPGTSVSKIVGVKNEEVSADAWVRLLVNTEFVKDLNDEVVEALDENVISMDLSKKWTKSNGTVTINGKEYDAYTYNEILAPNTSTEPLFEEVKFAPKMGNEYQNSTLHIDVIAQAVQADNNPGITGWPVVEVPEV